MKTISVKLSVPLAAWLASQAKDSGRSQSDLVRDALERRRNGGDKTSCHEMLADLCGRCRGPRDLSTNSKHMEGFGR